VTKATICIDGLETDVYIGATEEEKVASRKLDGLYPLVFLIDQKLVKAIF